MVHKFDPAWPSGTGEMAQRIRGHDWVATLLGSVATWPRTLRSTVDLVVAHGFPMMALWGPDLIQIYNDGYRFIMADRHPAALGEPTRKCWPEVWHVNAPIYARVLAGETVTFEDALYPITRHGPLEDAWFTLTCSPLHADDGAIAGVLVTAFETTERHLANNRRDESEAFRRVAQAGGRMGSWRWDLAERTVRGDTQFLALWGFPPSDEPLPLAAFTARQSEEGVAQTEAVVAKAIAAGEEFDAEVEVVSGPAAGRWLRWRGRASPSDDSVLYGVSFDITEQRQAEAALRESEDRLREVLNSMAEGFALFDPDFTIVDINDATLELDGRTREELVGRSHWEAFPGSEDSPVGQLFKRVMRDRTPGSLEHVYTWPDGRRMWIEVRAYPNRKGRVACFWHDITTVKEAAEALRDSEERQAFLLRLSDALRAEPDVAALANCALQMLAEQLRLDRCYIALMRVEEDWAEYLHQVGNDRVPPMPDGVRLSSFPKGLQVAFRKSLVIDDLAASEDLSATDRQSLAALCHRALAAAFLRNSDKGTPHWVLCAVSAEPRPWTLGEVALIEETAERVWAAMERAHAEKGLRESEARLAAALESAPAAVAVVDLTGRSVVSNAEYRRFLPSDVIPSRDSAKSDRWRAWNALGERLALNDFPSARALRGERVVPGQEMLFTDDDGREIWTMVSSVPIRDDGGRIKAVATVINDVDVQKRATEALRESEERLRQFGEASQDVLWVRDAETLQWEYLTPAFETIYGLDREAALRGDNMINWLDLIIPEDRPLASASLERVRHGEWVTFEFRISRPSDGQIRWLRNTDFPIRNASGAVQRIGGIGHDVTELKHTEEALAAGEARQRALLEGIPQLVWRAIDGGEWTSASPQWTKFTGQAGVDSHGWGWLEPLHPDDREVARVAWAEAAHRGALDVEYRIRRADGGSYRWFHTRASPVRNTQDQIIEWLGTSTDIHDLRELQEQQKVLVAELQHRTRNLMGVVRSMSDMTARSSADLPDFLERFRDRLEALARVQGLLSRLNEHDRVVFDEMIHAELEAMSGNSERVSLEGPRGVRLRSSTVQTLAMAIHELATNAVKYGALSQPTGMLAVTWRLEQSGPADRLWLHIDWRESGVLMPLVGVDPSSGGQGRELIERALPYQLSAETSYELGPDGVHCAIAMPVSATMSLEDIKRG